MEAVWRRPGRVGAVAASTAIFIVVLWGGYGHHWSWTGISSSTATLWDWLNLLLLPIAFALLPILLSRRTRIRPAHKRLVIAAAVLFGFIALAGYLMPWGWTGFVGNKLWDWLELLALPSAIALIPLIPELRSRWEARHSVLAAAGLAVFVGIVIAGYAENWAWTGFRGNTLWDWMHLLLLPLLLPTVIVPALVPAVSSRMVVVDDVEPPAAEPAAQRGRSQ